MLIARRTLLGAIATAPFAGLAFAAEPAPTMRIQRLAWAGIRLEFAGATLFLDPLIDRDVWADNLKDPMVPVNDGKGTRFVAVSHRHPDHMNPKSVRAALGENGTLIHFDAVQPVSGVRSRPAALYEPLVFEDFTATCVPAADGYGDPQVSWIVSGGGKRIIHCGDTLWHGHWWTIGRQYGPFDAAFLPINGARFRWQKPWSEVPAVLTPEQAVAAALILGARRLVPIHFGVTGAEGYVEVADVRDAALRAGRARDVPVTFVEPGAWLDWDAKA